MLLPVPEVVARRALAVTVVVAPPAQLVAPGSRAPNLTRPAYIYIYSIANMSTSWLLIKKKTHIFFWYKVVQTGSFLVRSGRLRSGHGTKCLETIGKTLIVFFHVLNCLKFNF